ncbi:MAG: acyl-[ACP]--phospholipid O-acyltransferase, partial [Pirellulales bacterium]
MAPSSNIAAPLAQGGIGSRSFLALLATQCLGALNDNIFRWFCVLQGTKTCLGNSTLSLGLICFTLPYLLLASHAAFVGDRFSKQRTIVTCKFAEILVMAIAVSAMALGGVDEKLGIVLVFLAVFLMGSQSAMFGPAKFGAIPELVQPEKISAANGYMQMVTTAASALGMFAGFVLSAKADLSTSAPTIGALMWPAGVLITIAVLGTLASLLIEPLTPADPSRRAPNPFKETISNLSLLFRNRPLFRAALGESFFWFLASLATSAITLLGDEVLGLSKTNTGLLAIALVVGVGIGSVLAGLMSGDKVELGLVPFGSLVIVASAFGIWSVTHDVDLATQAAATWPAAIWLSVLGLGAGFFIVPLVAFVQDRSDRQIRGTILAAANFVTFSMTIIAAITYYLMTNPDWLGWGAPTVFLAAGIGTIPILIYVIWLLPQATIRFFVWLASRTVYRVSVHGLNNLPRTGGAMLLANHMSFVDGVLLLVTSSRPVRFVAHSKYAESFWLRWLARTMKVIPIDGEPQQVRQALQTAQAAVAAGELVCIFPEGRISQTGLLENFRPDLMQVVQGTDAPVIPIYLDGLWGSIFSYRDGRSVFRWPRKWPYPVSILIGRPIGRTENVDEVRNALQAVGVEAANKRESATMNLPLEFIRECRRRGGRSKIADATDTDLSGRNLLIRTLVLRRLLLRHVLQTDEKYVGVLIPPSVGGAVTNAALTLSQRVAVNLNYTVSSDVMNNCIAQCGIKHVLTSRQVMKKLDLEIDTELVYLEDFRKKVTKADKFASAIAGIGMPTGMLARRLGIHQFDPEETFTLIFTSGSTGEPKGVMLTRKNVASNIRAIDELVQFSDDDVMVGILPFFHSMGFTATLWTVLMLKLKGVYHFSPLDARAVGTLCGDHQATLLLSTPTFLRGFLRRCTKEQFQHIDTVITGAEKLPSDVADAFENKFGVRPYEGYGCTELSPLASVNIPPSRATGPPNAGLKEGTVGRPIPNVMAKIVDLDSGEDLGVDQPGMLLIKGPNVMRGYLNKPDVTSKVIRDGWYVTGDVAKIDTDGFIQITGRQSRFSKIGGEMVPHVGVEESINQILASESANPEEDAELKTAVTSVPDAKKGERLIVLHIEIDKSPDEICKALPGSGFPPIWIPSPDSFLQVDEIPVLGTGKLDLKAIKQIA